MKNIFIILFLFSCSGAPEIVEPEWTITGDWVASPFSCNNVQNCLVKNYDPGRELSFTITDIDSIGYLKVERISMAGLVFIRGRFYEDGQLKLEFERNANNFQFVGNRVEDHFEGYLWHSFTIGVLNYAYVWNDEFKIFKK